MGGFSTDCYVRAVLGARNGLAAAVPAAVAGVFVVTVAAASGCSRPLPEEGSAVANLYVERCSTGCHRPHQPGSMTVAMWQLQFERMQPVIARAGRPPLTAGERAEILAYLERNAEGRGQAGR